MATESLEFFQALFPEVPEGSYIRIWTLSKSGKQSESTYHSTAEEAAGFCSTVIDRHCYFGVALGPDVGPHRRGSAAEVTAISGMWADIDIAGEGHADKLYPRTIEEAREPLNEMPPTIVIHSGGGLQAYWLFKELEELEGEADRQRMQTLANRWKRYLKYRYHQRGFAIDSVQDLARVLRVPGTFNVKTDTPRPVRILEHKDGRRYNPSDLDEFLDSLGISAELLQHEAKTPVVVDSGMRLDATAEMPMELLRYLLERDQRFKAVWERKRSDFKDQSQSSYDQAIANHLCANGVPDQVVVNAMIQHRRVGGNKQKLRIDYYTRTLAKAKEKLEPPTIPQSEPLPAVERVTTSAKPEDSPLPSDVFVDDSQVKRGKALEQASQMLGVEIVRIQQLGGSGSDSKYHVLASGCGGVIVFDSYPQFKNQEAFKCKIEERVHRLLPDFKKDQWKTILDLLMKGIEKTAGGEQLELESQAMCLVENYVNTNSIYSDIDESDSESATAPITMDGKIYIDAGDLRRWHGRSSREKLDAGQLASMLVSIGALCHEELKSRWELPVSKFPAANYIQRGRRKRLQAEEMKGQPQ